MGGLYRWRSTGPDTGTITLNTIAWSEGAPSNAYLLLRSVPRPMGRFLGVYRRRNGGREFLGNHQKVWGFLVWTEVYSSLSVSTKASRPEGIAGRSGRVISFCACSSRI